MYCIIMLLFLLFFFSEMLPSVDILQITNKIPSGSAINKQVLLLEILALVIIRFDFVLLNSLQRV